ncbi:MAG: DUF2889 domain-containing protein [Xanthomonadales bacterium]|nr:DUF2889 domain-containing protein [Xanthomonadales bacterium]
MDAATHARAKVDICAGWRRDGAMVGYIEATGRLPMPVGPVAPDLDVGDPPPSTLELPELPANALRRRRRIDVCPGIPVRVDSMFRDSHMTIDEVETVLHEYGLRVAIDPETGGIVSARAEPRVLPWPECGDAAASARELVGRRLAGLSRAIRSEMLGPSTCTHLNDLMRALEGVEHLATPDVSTQPPYATGER